MHIHRSWILILALTLAGCATGKHYPADLKSISAPGSYHEVKRGETLWSIARTYDMDLKKLIAANRLPDASKIEISQLIFIPEAHARSEKPVAPPKQKAKLENFIWPVKGDVISYFGSVSNMTKNKGIDIQTNMGTSILASRSGTVTFANDRLKGYGKTIIIDHMDGFETVYAHNSQNLVIADQYVKQGEVIGKAGKTGRATRPTLHFEIRKKHDPQNPFYYLP